MRYVPYSAIYIDMTFFDLFSHFYPTFHPSHPSSYYLNEIASLFLSPNPPSLTPSQPKKCAQSDDPPSTNSISIFSTKKQFQAVLPTICVRSSLDLLFQCLQLPLGSEVLMSAMNIPDMVKIVRYHGLTPVPVDLDFKTMNVKLDEFKNYLEKTKDKGNRPRVFIMAWVFGSYCNPEELYSLCKQYNVFIVEDMAETFFDIHYNGSPMADISIFSFGTIKLNTALGGALSVIRGDEALYRKMKGIYEGYTYLSTSFFLKRWIKVIPVMLALNNTYLNGYGREIVAKLGIEYKEKVVGLVRGFHPTDDFLSTFRKKLPTPMLAFLYYRLKSYDKEAFDKGTKRQETGKNFLVEKGVAVPGSHADYKYYWLYPVIVPDAKLCYKMLNDKGIDAYLGATQLKPVEVPHGSKYKPAKETTDLFDKIIYLPIHKNVPLNSVMKICREVVDVCEKVKAIKECKMKMPKL